MSSAEISVVQAVELDEPCSPWAAYERMRAEALPWMLESALLRDDIGRYSFVGADPYGIARLRGGGCVLEWRRPVRRSPMAVPRGRVRDPFEWLRGLLPSVPIESPAAIEEIPFHGGAVGYLGYEIGASSEPVTLRAEMISVSTPWSCFWSIGSSSSITHCGASGRLVWVSAPTCRPRERTR